MSLSAKHSIENTSPVPILWRQWGVVLGLNSVEIPAKLLGGKVEKETEAIVAGLLTPTLWAKGVAAGQEPIPFKFACNPPPPPTTVPTQFEKAISQRIT